jgi:hypothetical protein
MRYGETFSDGQREAGTDADERIVGDSGPFRPRFTPAAKGAAGDAVPHDVAVQAPTVVEPVESDTDAENVDEPVEAPAAVEADQPASSYTNAGAAGDGADLDQPLLSGDTELLGRWQRLQAGFIDDPQVAVAGAADLVEQAGQALVDTLRQRQRQMRAMWDRSPADEPTAPGDMNADTEQLRQVMLHYRVLFNQLCQPV